MKLFKWVTTAALALPLAAMASTVMTNPVTGETETYENVFTSETTEWNSAENWTLKESDKVPFVSGGNYDPALVDGKTVSTETAIDGWTLRVGAYNGAAVTWNGGVTKIQAGSLGCWLTADETSSITIASFAGNQLEGGDAAPFKLSSAKAGGITWSAGLTSAGNTTLPFWYYLKGAGTVVYGGDITVANAQVIKMADVALSGTSQVASKTLVTFGSGTTKTFTADAAVKIKDGDNVLRTVYLTSVTADATTLTTEADVGTCELVQTSAGIDLYWVDGDPANLPAPTVYKPSININFTNGAGNGLTTGADVGLSGYEVPGTSWNNYVVANNTFSTVNAVDSTGAASAMSGVSVTISGTRGSHSCGNLTPSSNPLHGYIDENAGNATPTVTVTGIPYYKYRVLVYHSTDTANVPFGYDTINGKNYTYVEDALSEGSTAWGNSGPQNGANAIAEGGNVLVTEALSGSTLTVVGHRAGGNSSARGCIAAIQIIEVKADVGENDLEIAVDGEREYTVTAEDAEKTGTVYLTGSGTLTLAGENKISAATIEISEGVTLVVNADRLDATTFTGSGTVVYDGSQPDTTKGFDNSAWTGTVWVKNVGDTSRGEATDSKVTTCLGSNTADPSSNDLNKWGNANSFVKFTNVRAYMAAANVPWTLILEDDSTNYAWYNNEGWTARTITIAGLKGNGTFWDINDGGCRPFLNFTDASQFSGSIKALGKQVFLNGAGTGNASDLLSGRIVVPADQVLTASAGETWHTRNGLVVNGTLSVNGTLGSESTSSAVSGSGTVVFGGVPSPTGDAWWKNAAWTGTVEIKGVSALNGDYLFNDYGNSGSTLKLTNCSGWLKPNYTCVPALEIGGTFSWNDGSSGLNNTFKVATLKGSGTISIPNQGAATAVWQITDDWSGFTGAVVGNNGAAKRILVFGSTLPSTVTAGDIYISEGATLDLDNSSSAWWGVGMRFVVDGTVKASARNKWGGGTGMVLGDTGVLELVSSSNTNDEDTNMSGITGTGTLKFSSSAGWRAFPKTDANMPATTLTIQTELADSLILPTKTNDVTVIGNLAGSKNIRSDWANNGPDGRILTVTQSKDTGWQGKFVSNRISQFNVVAPTEGTPGTLTLSGAQEATIPMQIDGAVNLTGTWVGATTVAGTFGGTGTLTGDLTFSDGATLKANASALTVSGTVTIPAGEGESLTIDATGLDADEVTILSSESITTETDVSKVTVNGLYTVASVAGAIKLSSTRVEVTVPAINNATVTVSVGGETIGTEAGTYKVAPDAVVTATYAAEAGYEISGQTVYTIDVSNSETTFDPAGTTDVKQYVAYVVFQQEQEYDSSYYDVTNYYTTVAAAIDAAKAMKKTVVLIAQPDEADTYNMSAGDVVKIKKGEFTFDGIVFPEGPQYNNTTTETDGVTQYKCAVYTATVQYPGEDAVGMTGQLIQILGGLYSGYVPAYAGTVVTVLDGSDATVGDAMPEVFTYNSETHTYTLKTMVASINTGAVDIYYPTISNAFEAVVSGQTIKVLCDNTSNVRSVRVKEGATVTLDLNGCTVTGPSGDNPMFWLEDNSNFVVTDTSEDKAGKLVSEASKVVWSNNRCTFTLTAGTLESGNMPIYIYEASAQSVPSDTRVVNVNGGKLICKSANGGDACIVNTPGRVYVTGGVIESTVRGIRAVISEISGGTVQVGNSVFYNDDSFQVVTGGTFNKDVSKYVPSSGYEILNNGDGTYTVRKDNGWMYAAPGYWDYTGTWTEGAALGDDKVTFSDGATYSNRTASAGQLVTLDMTLSFDDVNDDDDDFGDAKAAIRLGAGETEGAYVFQLYTYEGSAATWKNATGFTPTVETDYNVLFVLDLTNKTYTASIVSGSTTNALSVGGSTTIAFANQNNTTPVQQIDFVGSGTVSSIEGSYEDAPAPEGFVVDEEVTLAGDDTATLTAAQATWLNACGAKVAVAAKIATMDSTAFNNAYLLNLDITGDFSYEFKVSNINVAGENVTLTVSLTRTGALANKINGTVALTGTDELGKTFATISEAVVTDDDFSDNGSTTTITLKTGGAKFFQPTIE